MSTHRYLDIATCTINHVYTTTNMMQPPLYTQSPIKKDIALLLHILTAVFADINPQDLLHASDAPMSDTHQPSHISTTKAGDGDKVSTTTHKATGQSHSTAQHGGNRSTLSQRVRAQRAAAGGTDRDRLFMLQAQQAMARMKVCVCVWWCVCIWWYCVG